MFFCLRKRGGIRVLNLRWLRGWLRQNLRLKAAPRLELTLVTAFPLTGRAHMRTPTGAPAPACISHRNYRKLSIDEGCSRKFGLKPSNHWRKFFVFEEKGKK